MQGAMLGPTYSAWHRKLCPCMVAAHLTVLLVFPTGRAGTDYDVGSRSRADVSLATPWNLSSATVDMYIRVFETLMPAAFWLKI